MKQHLDKVQEVLDHDLTKKAIKIGAGGLKVFRIANMIKSVAISTVIYSGIFGFGWFAQKYFHQSENSCVQTSQSVIK